MRRWTEEEDERLVTLMREYLEDYCLSDSMEFAAKDLERTPSAIRNRWEGLRKKYKLSTPEISSYDDIILKTIKKNPYNLSNAFRELSTELNYSVGYISAYWYSKLRYKESAKCFILISENKGYINSKNVTISQDDLIIKNGRKTIWNRFLSFFKKII